MKWSATWPHVRAVLVLLHLVGILLLALPYSPKLGSKSHWAHPRQQAELERWSERLGVEHERFEEFLWDVSQAYIGVRKRLIRPFYRLADYTGARQGWSMFAHPRVMTGRLDVYILLDEEWHRIRTPHSSDEDWMRWQFDHNRVRKLLGRLATRPHQPAYNEMTTWIARRVAEDFPEVTRAKVSLITWKSLEPSALRAGDKVVETLTRNQEFDLEALR